MLSAEVCTLRLDLEVFSIAGPAGTTEMGGAAARCPDIARIGAVRRNV